MRGVSGIPGVSSSCFSCRIADSAAVKPDDWDEDAPRQIPDEDAEKPEGWLDHEPADMPDPGGAPGAPTHTHQRCVPAQDMHGIAPGLQRGACMWLP